MGAYILKRIVGSILILLLIMVVTFLLMNAIPGSPFLTEKSTPEQIAMAEAKYGLDKPLHIQLWNYIKNYLKGDLGTSLKMQEGTDVGKIIFQQGKFNLSIKLGISALVLAVLIGIPLGAIAGSVGGWVDNVIMRITDVFLSFPPLLLAIALVALLGSSLTNAIVAIAISWWPWYTRLVRGQAVSMKERKFVQAAETIGTSRAKIIFKHILPNCISPIIVQASMDLGGVIMTIASLSFLGLGAQAPTPEWGLMISTGRSYFPDKWWCCIFPGLAIFITVLCFNLLGDAIREILDPKTRKK